MAVSAVATSRRKGKGATVESRMAVSAAATSRLKGKGRLADGDSSALSSVKRNTKEFPICKTEHVHVPGGDGVWDAFSIKIWPNIKSPRVSEVRIYGIVGVHCYGKFVDYLFKRSKKDAQVFKNPGKKALSLTLQGPVNPWVLSGDCGELGLYCMLKYNDEYVYDAGKISSIEKRCLELFVKHNRNAVGFAYFSLPHIPLPVHVREIVMDEPFQSSPGASKLDNVASVRVELMAISHGMVAFLKFTVLGDFKLYGKIMVRSCHVPDISGLVLFHKTETEAVQVKSNECIPLSRSFTALQCRASLVIKVRLCDASSSRTTLCDETIHFEDDPRRKIFLEENRIAMDFSNDLNESTSEHTTLKGLIKVEVKWTQPAENPTYSLTDGYKGSVETAPSTYQLDEE